MPMMEPYFLVGAVKPERAHLSLSANLEIQHLTSGRTARVRLSVVLNQIALWIHSEDSWDLHDIRNVAKNLVQIELAVVGYLHGLVYDFEITRIICAERNIDYVYGIDIPCLANRVPNESMPDAVALLRRKISGTYGIYVNRCLSDLMSAMRHADDTGFYCYRAIEALRNHCASLSGLQDESKAVQWARFREVANCDAATIGSIKEFADPERHGHPSSVTSAGRANLFVQTWDLVDAYLKAV